MVLAQHIGMSAAATTGETGPKGPDSQPDGQPGDVPAIVPEVVPVPPQPEKPPAAPQPGPAPVRHDPPEKLPVPHHPEKGPAEPDDPVDPDRGPGPPEPGVIQASGGTGRARGRASEGDEDPGPDTGSGVDTGFGVDTGPEGDAEAEGEGPMRRCALSRAERPVAEMIRFVAAPDGTILADIAHKLPGRGVWIEASRAAIAEAQKRNVFARSLKRTVKAEPDLPDQVERLLMRRLIDSVALANKAGLVVTGATKVSAALEKGNILAMIHGKDGARDGIEKLDRKFRAVLGIGDATADLGDVIVEELTIHEISLAIGRPNVVHAALRSGGASERLLENARRLRRFRATRDKSF